MTGVFYESVAGAVIVVMAALGLGLLRRLGMADDRGALAELLYACGLSFALLETAAFVLEMAGWLRRGTALALLLVAAAAAGSGWRRLYELGARLFPKRERPSFVAWLCFLAILTCAALDALLAMAPLTGSDALVYHFTVPKLGLTAGTGPLFWLTKGFWVGEGHSLIALGLALGSDRVSMGCILFGGLLTAAAVWVMTRELASERWAGLAVLVFLLTPMVFWQMSTSGSPDIWMAFFTTVAVLAVSRGVQAEDPRWLVLGGVLAGAAAGVKFTGWAVPVALVTYAWMAKRSPRRAAACLLGSLPTGILPLVRNIGWTGDPFFPFLTRWLRPEHLNYYTLAAIQADTHPAGFNHHLGGLLAFPFLLSLQGNAFGVGQYFGPIILALAPLLIFAFRRKGLAYAAAWVWCVVFLLIDLTSQMARFLLPVFPLALALTMAAVAEVFRRGWRAMQAVSAGTLALALLFGTASEALYARDFLPVVVGRERREAFLERMAPDYRLAAFVNHSLAGQNGEVMVFFQHVYYLRVPFLIGSPEVSWLMDPERLNHPQALLQFFRQQDVRWVVKSPDFPKPVAAAFQSLEDQGKLCPRFSTNAAVSTDLRIYGREVPVHVAILEVVPGTAVANGK